jgi:hypothetical protein
VRVTVDFEPCSYGKQGKQLRHRKTADRVGSAPTDSLFAFAFAVVALCFSAIFELISVQSAHPRWGQPLCSVCSDRSHHLPVLLLRPATGSQCTLQLDSPQMLSYLKSAAAAVVTNVQQAATAVQFPPIQIGDRTVQIKEQLGEGQQLKQGTVTTMNFSLSNFY